MSEAHELTVVSVLQSGNTEGEATMSAESLRKEASLGARALRTLFEALQGDSEEIFRAIADPISFEVMHTLISREGDVTSGYGETLAAVHRAICKMPFKKTGLVSLLRSGLSEMRSHTDILSAATRVRASAADLRQSVRITQSVDNGLVQDGFTLESELVLLSRDGCVAILHAARCSETDQQRCYLWSIEGWKIEGLLEPHAGVLGASVGEVTSLVHKSSAEAQNTVLELLKMDPNKFVQATRRYDAQEGQESAHLVDMKRVTSIRAFINEKGLENFCEVASLEAVGQRTAEFLADFSHFVSGCLIRFPDIARSALKSRVRVSSERLDLVKRISFLMQSLSDGGLVPPVVAKRVRKRIGNIDQLIVSRTKRATGVSTRKAKVRKTVRRVQKESQKAQALPAKKRSAEQQEMLPEATSLETRDVESARARVAAARKNRQKRIASATNGVKAASPIRRKTVQISVDQLALF